MSTSFLNINCREPEFVLAVTVIQNRLQNMPKEDRDDLFSLLPLIWGDDNEEKKSAIIAANEILEQSASRVSPMPTPKQSIGNWLTFVGGKLREAREVKGITQGQLADITGLQQSHISRLEKGEHSPTHKTLKKIADALGVEVSFFDPSA